MRARLGRWSKKLPAGPAPPVGLVGADAVAVGALPRVVIRGLGFPTSTGQHILYDLAIAVGGALIWCLVAAIVWWAHGRAGPARRYVVEHRGRGTTAGLARGAGARVS